MNETVTENKGAGLYKPLQCAKKNYNGLKFRDLDLSRNSDIWWQNELNKTIN